MKSQICTSADNTCHKKTVWHGHLLDVLTDGIVMRDEMFNMLEQNHAEENLLELIVCVKP